MIHDDHASPFLDVPDTWRGSASGKPLVRRAESVIEDGE
jgi:hypothetical protein